jgi:hypothetical protein
VICKIRNIEEEYLARTGNAKQLRGYGRAEKKFFLITKKHYPYIGFLRNTNQWVDFYNAFLQCTKDSNIAFSTLESLQISDDVVNKLTTIQTWYSSIPTFINASRQENYSTNSFHEHQLENSQLE